MSSVFVKQYSLPPCVRMYQLSWLTLFHILAFDTVLCTQPWIYWITCALPFQAAELVWSGFVNKDSINCRHCCTRKVINYQVKVICGFKGSDVMGYYAKCMLIISQEHHILNKFTYFHLFMDDTSQFLSIFIYIRCCRIGQFLVSPVSCYCFCLFLNLLKCNN